MTTTEFKGISFKPYNPFKVVAVLIVGSIAFMLVGSIVASYSYKFNTPGTFDVSNAIMIVVGILYFLFLFFLVKWESGKIEKLGFITTIFGIAKAKDLDATLRLENDTIILQTPEKITSVAITQTNLLTTFIDPHGRYGVAFWKGTTILAKRLIDFIPANGIEDIKRIKSAVQETSKKIKVIDTQRIL
jgi:hypothetical protein